MPLYYLAPSAIPFTKGMLRMLLFRHHFEPRQAVHPEPFVFLEA